MECERNFALTLDGPTSTQQCLDAVGIQFGDSHPEYPTIYCLSGELTETDFYHAELTVSYGVVDPNAPNSAGAGGAGGDGGGGGGGGGGDDGNGPVANPLARADVWNFSSSTAEVPTAYAYDDGPGTQWSVPGSIKYLNATAPRKAIVNSVGDHIWSGVTKTVGQTKLTIKGNRELFAWKDAQWVTGKINANTWMGCKPGTWMCQGVSGTPQSEQVGEVTVSFWEVNVELIYREEGFILPLINEGLNSMQKDEETGEWEKKRVFVKSPGMPSPGVPADLPVALDKQGKEIRTEGKEPTDAKPIIEPILIYYRVNGSIVYDDYFGSAPPPTVSLSSLR